MANIEKALIPRGGPALALVMRGGFALLAQTLVAGGFRLRRHPDPWKAATAWWTLHSSMADLGCLAVLRWLLHREGLRLRDLPSLDRQRLRQDLRDGLRSLGIAVIAGGVSTVLQRPFYPSGPPPLITVARMPRWARAYTVLVWPALWASTEELVYLGYALPRLEVQLGSTARAAALVALCWGPLQHPTLPAIPERRHVAYRALTSLPPTAMMTAIYLRNRRRLPPMIFAHWVADLATGLMIALQPQRAR
jgi:uncharacterized protein